jgi:hypothetical protein
MNRNFLFDLENGTVHPSRLFATLWNDLHPEPNVSSPTSAIAPKFSVGRE